MSNLNIREAGNRSRFYPKESVQIEKMVEIWEQKLNNKPVSKEMKDMQFRIAIVPHAGYIYSGFTAFQAYKLLEKSKFKRIIVVGPSHHVYINGISIAENEFYETPYGNLDIDLEYVEELQETFNIDFQAEVHYLEHSTETQMPFIKRMFPEVKVVEIVYGRVNTDTLFDLFEYILRDKDNCLIISTDLSHFHSKEKANLLDNNCITALTTKNFKLLDESCEACGKEGLKAILKYIIKNVWRVIIADYCTSGDVTGDNSRVVGYMSATI
jgi:MEMO1 family protein